MTTAAIVLAHLDPVLRLEVETRGPGGPPLALTHPHGRGRLQRHVARPDQHPATTGNTGRSRDHELYRASTISNTLALPCQELGRVSVACISHCTWLLHLPECVHGPQAGGELAARQRQQLADARLVLPATTIRQAR